MKNTSAPGIDGFTVAWVKEFWDELSDLCVQAVNDCFDKKILTKLLMIKLLNLMDEVNRKKTSCLILSIDFKKAFDSVDHRFIDSSLELLNFGPDFRRWVNLFFKDRETYLMMDG